MESFETGKYRHIPFSEDVRYEFIQGYVGNHEDCKKAVMNVEIVFDLGLPSIPPPGSLNDARYYFRTGDEHWSILIC